MPNAFGAFELLFTKHITDKVKPKYLWFVIVGTA